MKKSVIIPVIVVLVLGIAVLLFLNFHQKKELNEMVEQMEFEKSELEDEYEDLALQFDGYQQMNIQNDSLQERLAQEQQRVQDLLEELRITKVTNARRIAELKKELATVRAVMKDYVRQIDSLNATNQRLTVENQQYRQENQQVKQQNDQLSSINNQLTETVSRASMLEIASCTVTTLNKHDRKTRVVSQIRKLQFDYTIAKNITCEPGIKTLYIRIIDPAGNLLVRMQSIYSTLRVRTLCILWRNSSSLQARSTKVHSIGLYPMEWRLRQGSTMRISLPTIT